MLKVIKMYKKMCSLIITLFLSLNMAHAESTAPSKERSYTEKLDYQAVIPPQATQSKGKKIEVVEMFFFACPHCYKLEPKIEKWLKNQADDIEFIRIPAIIGPTWTAQARAFYIAEKLGIADEVRKKLFKSIHVDGKQIYNEYSVMTFFSELGVNPDKVLGLYESKEIMDLASQARVKTVKYGIRGVPAIIVNGKYYTATYFSTNHDKMLDVVDFLIDKERKANSEIVQTNN